MSKRLLEELNVGVMHLTEVCGLAEFASANLALPKEF